MTLKTKYTDLVERLLESDADSALTNEAARAIEELVIEMLSARAAFDSLYDPENSSNLVLLTSCSMEARIRKILQLETE